MFSLKISAELIVLTLCHLKTVSVEISEQHWVSAPTWINCRWCGVSLLHVTWAALTTGGTMILQSHLINFYGEAQLAVSV